VFHNESHAYDLETRTTYQEKCDDPSLDDTFEMQAIVRVKQQVGQKAPLRRLRSFVRITRDGELREVNAQLHIAINEWECLFDVYGSLAESRLLPRWRIRIWPADIYTEDRVFDRPREYTMPIMRDLELPFRPVEFADHGIILNPLQPPNRLDVLRPGQHW